MHKDAQEKLIVRHRNLDNIYWYLYMNNWSEEVEKTHNNLILGGQIHMLAKHLILAGKWINKIKRIRNHLDQS